eukprot:SAG31_NODE_2949_length_4871_cov_2.742456_3_plen_152_part_00
MILQHFAEDDCCADTHVLVTGIGERKRDGVETILQAEAAEHGFGRGETSAGMSNWRSLSNIYAPLVYAVRLSSTSFVCLGASLFGACGAKGCSTCAAVFDMSHLQAVYNRGAANGFPKALFLARMLIGAVLPELTFRMIPQKERKRLSDAA